jgi:hypothetical protein
VKKTLIPTVAGWFRTFLRFSSVSFAGKCYLQTRCIDGLRTIRVMPINFRYSVKSKFD